ncbi:MAG: DUF4345 domain-containing protein [Armatimonadota bacterium]
MTRRYLLFSASLLCLIALGYGVAPGLILPLFLDLAVDGIDLTHIFRAIMGLYLAMSFLWIAGAYLPSLTLTAVIAETVFMAGLALGRLLSVFVDGQPSPLLVVGLVIEALLAVWGGGLAVKLRSEIEGPQGRD